MLLPKTYKKMSEKIRRLHERLYFANVKSTNQHFSELISAIRNIYDAVIASLWSVNHNCTKGNFLSASLLKRELPEQFLSSFNSETDFVHDLSDSFIDDVLKHVKNTNEVFYCCKSSDCHKHRSYQKLENLNIKYYVGIPIHSRQNDTVTSIICLYFRDAINYDEMKEIAAAIDDFVSISFERMLVIKKQQISDRILALKKETSQDEKPNNFFYAVLNEVFKEQCDFEGGSVFEWDYYENRFNLLATTGIEKNEDDVVFYLCGEGLTGQAAVSKRIIIYDSLSSESRNEQHQEKWKEITKHKGETMLVLPLLRVSDEDEVIGIIRLVNKVNGENPTIIDFFNEFDVEVLDYVSKLLSIILESYISNEMRNDFMDKLSHEMKTPACSIYKSAIQLHHHIEIGNDEFVKKNILKYLSDIMYFSDFQKWQATTNLFLSKSKRNLPLFKQYNVKATKLRDIVKKSRSIVIPIAREYGVSINGILIRNDIPTTDIYVDENAFIIVFYNLLTNAIKYNNSKMSFYVGVSAVETPDGFVISVEDYGIGVGALDRERIFQIGFRSENAIRNNANGFGIGLSVVKKIINDFGGDISVSNLNNPTIFRIFLPSIIKNNNYTKSIKWTTTKK